MSQVLVIHSDSIFAHSLLTPFEEVGLVPTLSLATDPEHALEMVLVEPPEVIVAEAAQQGWKGLELCETVRHDNAFSHVALLALFPPTGLPENPAIDWADPPFDDFLIAPVEPEDLTQRIQLSLSRKRRQLDANPLTRLPGNNTISLELERRMTDGEEFAVCYVDLDNFKAFNDKYGFSRGDEVLRLTARLLLGLVGALGPREGFVGHIGGDDFVFIVPIENAATVAGQIVDSFDRIIASLYDEEDRERGCIVSTNRRGELEEFPIMSISIAVVHNRRGRLHHLGEIAAIAADLKSRAKCAEGSAVVFDRRSHTPKVAPPTP